MDKINLKGVIMEDFCNYKKPSMFLITCYCNWKCCLEYGVDTSICQNSPIVKQKTKTFDISYIYKSYISNDISKSIVIGGLEPLTQFEEIYNLISYFRNRDCKDIFVIYTGYTEEEVINNPNWKTLTDFDNTIFKFGRFIPNQEHHYDDVLGIYLASDNQYGKKFNFTDYV